MSLKVDLSGGEIVIADKGYADVMCITISNSE